MLRLDDGIVQSPYFDTFHDIEIYCEAVYWDMDEPYINFRSTKGFNTTNKAYFSSKNFYSEQQFHHLQGIDFKHPLVRIRDYSLAYNTNEFFVYELARYLNLPETQCETVVIDLAQEGLHHRKTQSFH
jgi:hypothetical protein